MCWRFQHYNAARVQGLGFGVLASEFSGRCDVCGRHSVQCNIFLGDGLHPSSCAAPAETYHTAGSAREPVGHSMCTNDTSRHRDSVEPDLATSCVSQIRLDARRPLDSTTSHGDTFQIL